MALPNYWQDKEQDDFGFGAAKAPSVPQVAGPAKAPDYRSDASIAKPTAAPGYQPSKYAFQGESLGGDIEGFARNTLQTPSRFDIPMVQQGVEVINNAIEKQRQKGRRSLDELMSQRGTVGSSVEAEQNRLFEEDLQSQSQQRLHDLSMEQARTLASDRGMASQIGLQAGEFGRMLGADRENANRYGMEFGFQTDRSREDDLRARANLALEAGRLEEASELNRAANELARAQFGFGAGMAGAEFGEGQRRFDTEFGFRGRELAQQESQFGRGLEEQRAARLQSLGIDERQLDLAATELQQRAKSEGRSLDLQQARDEAEVDIRARQLQQQAELEGRGLDLEEARNQAQREQFTASIGEQKAARLQSLGIDTQRLGLQAQEIQQRERMQGREISSQEAMQDAELGARAQMLATEIQADAARQGRSIDADAALQQGRIQAEKDMEADRLEFGREELGERTAQRLSDADLSRLDIMLRALASGLTPEQIKGQAVADDDDDDDGKLFGGMLEWLQKQRQLVAGNPAEPNLNELGMNTSEAPATPAEYAAMKPAGWPLGMPYWQDSWGPQPSWAT